MATSRYPILGANFSCYSEKLDYYYDKHEKIFKLNRDLTRDSKKLISSMHILPGVCASEKASVLQSAQKGLFKLRDSVISVIAIMLQGEPLYLYTPPLHSGMEEYVEALLFFSFLKRGSIMSFREVQRFLLQPPSARTNGKDNSMDAPEADNTETRCGNGTAVESNSPAGALVLDESDGIFTTSGECPSDDGNALDSTLLIRRQMLSFEGYILGLSDVSGELMRFYIKSVAVGEVEESCGVVDSLRQMRAGYQALGSAVSKNLSNKIFVHERNLTKVENICYNLKLQRSELSSEQFKEYLLKTAGSEED